MPQTIDWVDGRIALVDQTALPELRVVHIDDADELVDAIRRLVVRGAPALGAAGALGVALAARSVAGAELADVAARLSAARPTAANLAVGVRRAMAVAADGPDAVLAAAQAVLQEDIAACRAIGARGADLLTELCGPEPLRLHTHCNAGALACVEWGTALGVVRSLHEAGRVANVVADETRPVLQGSRITAVELAAMGVPFRVVVDGAGASIIARGLVDAVVVGADRVAANGDVANKIGTYPLALAAARAGIPFVVAAPESTLDPATPDGAAIEIEERAAEEVLVVGGVKMAPDGSAAWNPAFDVTPADLVTAVVTEKRVWRPGT
ncbi:S-methyl-5-thioribose-1-phosphate isomerase [Pseudonocardia alaniniphila]|uniref:Methylthioribose-1-phosphate isomerase n=1 Tax=Pseudonocardia alaniniphila TaxID=75291 RepID=A0ABS9THQ4_9PSEU|nr:S-methyl-5-thioribose-1-phosphate isomerase [Pseudonocardia alaniniphila]MCH6167938.1 S-methyl-5-thioribose-1-phosphate isomerase [Pseudonocardia alaniniphila]